MERIKVDNKGVKELASMLNTSKANIYRKIKYLTSIDMPLTFENLKQKFNGRPPKNF